ncbi:MAG: hypothetical protein J6T92_04380 [Ottowia sp.]|nr:hypothetical protein [Ottowia sp.]
MSVKKIAGVFALSAIALALSACGGDDGPAPGPNHRPNTPNAPAAGLLPEKIEFDVVEERLMPGATVPLEAELETGRDRDVPAAGAANVEVSIVRDDTGGAQLSGTQLSTNQQGEARFSITLGRNTGTVIVKATTDGADNNVANGISNELSVLLGMVVGGNGMNWELPAVIEARTGGTVRLEDVDDGHGATYSIDDTSRFTFGPCRGGDDVCLGVKNTTRAGSYDVKLTATAGSNTLVMPVTIVVR